MGGEQQRVAVVRAIVKDVDVILADEPIGNLDPSTAKGIIAIFKAPAQEENKCVFVATHSEAFALGRRMLLKAPM